MAVVRDSAHARHSFPFTLTDFYRPVPCRTVRHGCDNRAQLGSVRFDCWAFTRQFSSNRTAPIRAGHGSSSRVNAVLVSETAHAHAGSKFILCISLVYLIPSSKIGNGSRAEDKRLEQHLPEHVTCGNLANARYIGCRNVIKIHEREVLIKRCGKSLLRSPALHLRCFSYSLSQVRGITSLQPRRNGDSVAITAHV